MSELWEQIKQEFEPDGVLRDIYVLDTDIHDWQRLLIFLQTNYPDLSFQLGGEPSDIPETVSTIFEHNEIASSLLSVGLAEIAFNCHFFSTNEIEFDFDPRDIKDQSSFEHLLLFLTQIGKTIGKEVFVAYESCPETTFLKFDPQTASAQFIPAKTYKEVTA